MFTKEDILARLQNGDSMDEIAKEMSDALNAAGAEYEEAKQVNAEAERVMNAKRAAVDMILDGLCDYLVAAGDEELLEELKDVDTDEVIEALDSILVFTKSIGALKGLEFPLIPKAKESCGKGDCGCSKPDAFTVKVNSKDADAIIKAFLRNI